MTHKYWEDDTPERHEYFEEKFFSNAKLLATEKGVPVSSILSQVTDETSFEATLEEVMSVDPSLEDYIGNLSPEALREFFNMPKIQDLVSGNIPTEEEIPEEVVQVEGVPEELFTAYWRNPETNKVQKILARKIEFTRRGKIVTAYIAETPLGPRFVTRTPPRRGRPKKQVSVKRTAPVEKKKRPSAKVRTRKRAKKKRKKK